MESELLKLIGIGPSIAKKILSQLRDYNLPHSTRAELLKSLHDPRIYPKLPAATRADLKFRPNKMIPRDVITKIAAELKKIIAVKHTIAGSYRRHKPQSRDIDLVICDKNTLSKLPLYKSRHLKFSEPFAAGPSKISVFLLYQKWTVKTDIFMTTLSEYPAMKLFATGSATFNVRMRYIAKKRGYLLNQFGVFRDGQKIPAKSEADIFRILGMKYYKPADRV